MDDIAFLALAQAHQHLHWLPAALRLAAEPGVRVTVLSPSRAAIGFIRTYDPDRTLNLRWLPTPALRRDGLFTPPKRRLTLLLHFATIRRYPVIVTTETTSALLTRLPGFASRTVHLKHGAGDREGGYNPKHAAFDLTLVNGAKDKQRLIERGLGTDANIKVVGYAKFELLKPPVPMFADGKRMALYNPHFDENLSSWVGHAPAIVAAMGAIDAWNFVVAPHVKLGKKGPAVGAAPANVLIDTGSVRSIDMSYSEAASVYIGDISSQVYEFVRRPRPCIFLNLDRIDWRENDNYAHWRMGQVVDDIADLGPALARADALQPQYEPVQRELIARSIDDHALPASVRQATAILDFIRGRA